MPHAYLGDRFVRGADNTTPCIPTTTTASTQCCINTRGALRCCRKCGQWQVNNTGRANKRYKATTLFTMVILLTQHLGALDDGRGRARVSLFRHKHEIESGRTSSVGMEVRSKCRPLLLALTVVTLCADSRVRTHWEANTPADSAFE